MAKLGVSELPETIVTKFGTGDYVVDVIQHAKVQRDRISGASHPGKWVKYYSRVVFSTFVTQFLARIPRLNHKSDFDFDSYDVNPRLLHS